MTEIGTQNGLRAKSIGIIQSSFPDLSDEQLSEVAQFVTTQQRLANLLNHVRVLNEAIGVKP